MVYLRHRAQVSIGEETTPGTKASSITHFPGIIKSIENLPDPEVDWVTFRGIGAGRDYNAIAEGKHVLAGELPLTLIKPDILFYAFGAEATVGTAVGGGGASDLDGATAVGDTSVTLTAATNYAADDYIQIGTGSSAEIRKITNVATNTLTLDKGLRIAHDDAETCGEVTTPYTHTLSVGNTLKPITLEAAIEDDTDFVRWFNGVYINSLTLECSYEGALEMTAEIMAMNASDSGSAVSTVVVPTTAPYMFDEGVITLFGGAIARIKSFKVNLKNNLEEGRYIQGSNARYPYEIIPGNRDIEIEVEAVPIATTWWDFLRPDTQSATSFSAKFSRSATDYIDIQGTGVYMKTAPHGLPEQGPVSTTITLVAKTCSIESKDTTPYYWVE